MKQSSCLVPSNRPSRPQAHLLCLHHAGGSARFFSEWCDHLDIPVAITAGLLPGRERRFGEPFPDTLRDAAAEIAHAFDRMWPDDVPVAIFGHSLGAMLAYESGCMLQDRGRRLARVFLSAVAPPPHHRTHGLRHDWSDERLTNELREMGGTPPEAFEHPDLMALCLRIIRADLELIAMYSHGEQPRKLDCPIVALGGRDDQSLRGVGLEGWRGYTDAGFEVQMFPGGHFYLDEHRELFMPWLQEQLQTLDAPSS